MIRWEVEARLESANSNITSICDSWRESLEKALLKSSSYGKGFYLFFIFWKNKKVEKNIAIYKKLKEKLPIRKKLKEKLPIIKFVENKISYKLASC